MSKQKIHLAIINITSWVGMCSDAEHVYGTFILSSRDDVNVNNIEEHNVKYLGENIELFRSLTLKGAQELDKKDGGFNIYERHYRKGNAQTNRFNTIKEVVDSGIAKYYKLGLKCPLISLYEGEKYDIPNEGKSIIINLERKWPMI